jgi:hypothetical protein
VDYDNTLNNLATTYNDNKAELEEAYWVEYGTIQEEYEKRYNLAWPQFNTGLSGVYELDTTSNNTDTLFNIIVDYVEQ